MDAPLTLVGTKLIFVGALCLSLMATDSMITSVFAQDMSELRFNTTANSFEGEGRPPSRTSAGSRDSCLSQIVALIPGKSEVQPGSSGCGTQSETLVALTLAEQPTFWFYISEPPYANITAEFVLLDESQNAIAIQPVSIEGTSGIIGVPLTQPLEVGVGQRWIFAVESSAGNLSQRAFVEGIVQRVEPDAALQTAIAATTSEPERVRVYANYGIWHDALTLLVELQQTSPSDPAIRRDWFSFLDSVGLGAIAQAPFLNCCTVTPSP